MVARASDSQSESMSTSGIIPVFDVFSSSIPKGMPKLSDVLVHRSGRASLSFTDFCFPT